MLKRIRVIWGDLWDVAGPLRGPVSCLLVMLVSSVTASATVVPRLSFDELTRGAEKIVHARCVAKDTYLESMSGTIWTRHVFEIVESLKGGWERQIVVSEPGGVYGSRGQWVPGAPHFEPGDEAILFLARTITGKWRVHGWGQGNFRVQQDPIAGASLVQADMSGIELAELSATPGQAPRILPRVLPARETMSRLKQRIREQLLKQAPLR